MGKTINVFLIDGKPTERIKCTLQNWTGVAYKIPRTQLELCKDGTNDIVRHLKQTGIYFLLGENMNDGNNAIYVGQAVNATFCSCSRLNSFYIVVKDIIGNKYKILCAMQVVMKNYYTTEGTVNGPIMAIPFDCCVTEISLPELMV